MGIFGWGGQSKDELKKIIVENENLITTLRDEKIEAQISENRAQSGFNAQKESDRARHQVREAELERQIEQLDADFDDRLSVETTRLETEHTKTIATEKAKVRKELRAEFGSELDTLKKANRTLTDESAKNKGLYDGALLVIKNLENQVKSTQELNATLVKALPTVSAAITTPNPSVVVGSNNKS